MITWVSEEVGKDPGGDCPPGSVELRAVQSRGTGLFARWPADWSLEEGDN
jgi:hypothetical protein